MRGSEEKQGAMLALISPSSIVPTDHPLRAIKLRADAALREMSPVFDRMYAAGGRPSVPPETLLKALLLMALYSIKSERQLCEQLRYNFLFRWFLDLDMVSPPFDPTTFSKNRVRMQEHDVCGLFFRQVVEQARAEGLMSQEHFSVDGSLIEAWASMKSFVPKEEAAKEKEDEDDEPPADSDNSGGKGGKSRIRKKKGRNPWMNFRGTKRSNDTHTSTTDPEARLMRKGKGQPAMLAYSVHALMENRNGLLADFRIGLATGTAERAVAIDMLASLPGSHQVTCGADRNYDTEGFVSAARALGVTPHVVQNKKNRRSAIDERTTRHIGYKLSLKARMFIETVFGWAKATGRLDKCRFIGMLRNGMYGHVVGSAFNLLRICKLRPVSA